MRITAQNGEVIEVKAFGVNETEIWCLLPKQNKGVLGTYESLDRAAEVSRQMGRHNMFSNDMFVMPLE